MEISRISRLIGLAALIGILIIAAACEATTEDAADDNDTDVAAAVDDDDAEEPEPTEPAEEAEPTEPVEEAEPTEEPEATEEPEPEPTPEPEPEPTEAPEPEEEEPEYGSRENPIPFGESAMIGDWEVRVVGTQPDGTQAVMDENMFNDPPEEGRQFFLVSIEATYHGPDSDSLWLAVTFRAVDDAGVAYSGFEDRCGVVPNDLQSLNEVFTGGTIEGNECWSVRSDHVDSLVMYAEEFISFTDDSRLFFSLRQDG